MSVIPLELLNKTFGVRSLLFPVANQQYEQSHRHTDVEMWMSITNWRNFAWIFGYPLLSGNCATKKIQFIFKKKSCVATKLHVWCSCRRYSQNSHSSSTKKKFNKFKSTILGECYFGLFFLTPISGQILNFACNFFDQNSLKLSFTWLRTLS